MARTRLQTKRAQTCKGAGKCFRRKRGGELERVLPCNHGCTATICKNAHMCKSPPLAGACRGDFCEPCTALLACAEVPAAGRGPCGICLEDDQDLVFAPMCAAHKLCTSCARRILFGTLPVLKAPTLTALETIEFLESNMEQLLHKHYCPFCRAKDTRTSAQKMRDMRAGGGKAAGYLKQIVERGHGMIVSYTAAMRR